MYNARRTKIQHGETDMIRQDRMRTQRRKILAFVTAFAIGTATLTNAQESLPPANDSYATPQGGFTHVIVYGPKGDFKPHGPMAYLNIVNPKLDEFGAHAGYFRSKVVPCQAKICGCLNER